MQRPSYSSVVKSSSVSSSVQRQADKVGDVDTFDCIHENFSPFQTPAAAAVATVGQSEEYIWSSVADETNATVESTVPLTERQEHNEHAFQAYFMYQVESMLRDFSKRFPFHHVIQWIMDVDGQCQHILDIDMEPPNKRE